MPWPPSCCLIHRSAWKARSAKAGCGIPHILGPRDRGLPDGGGGPGHRGRRAGRPRLGREREGGDTTPLPEGPPPHLDGGRRILRRSEDGRGASGRMGGRAARAVLLGEPPEVVGRALTPETPDPDRPRLHVETSIAPNTTP